MKVFWSWQSDTPGNNNHYFVRAALTAALERVAADLDLAEADRPEIDHDTKDEPGLVSIVDTIFKKIEQAAVFVADLTYVGKTESGKLIPNPNVMIELGHALTSVGPDRIILVANKAYGGRPEDLPFDLRHRRAPITYDLPASASGKDRARAQEELVGKLAGAMAGCLGRVLQKEAETVKFPGADAREDDPSIWLAKGVPLQHLDFHHLGGKESWEVVEAPRFYIRVIPAKYEGGKRSREIQDIQDGFRLYPMQPWSAGNGGVNSDGVVAVGLHDGQAIAVTQWFKSTSEVWAFNGAATFIHPVSQKRMLAWPAIAKGWTHYLTRVLAFLEHIGVKGPLRVELGVVGLQDTFWSTNAGQIFPSLNAQIRHVRENQNWDEPTRISFLTDAFNELADTFNQRSFAPDAFRQLANQN